MLTGFVDGSSPFTGLWSQAIVGRVVPLNWTPMIKTKVLYNDRCPICRAEIRHYRQRADQAGAPLVFEDLNATDLGAWQLTADQAKRRMHARLPDGQIVSGIPAFAAIWRALPGTGWLAWLVERPVLRGIADVLYNRVAAPLLYHKQMRREARGLAARNRQP
jgi:predicted DCC family thiol-disulfide oxidoreductase YuxK